jgi:iron complex transport system substrate-binding protein
MRLAPRALAGALVIGLGVTVALAGCSSSTSSEVTSATESAAAPAQVAASTAASEVTYPITVDHAYGTTTIEAAPERVATVAWANHEVPIALGIEPVGMSKATWGDDDADGVLPWVEDALTASGASTPVLFDETDGINFEAVADVQPDVILAAYSGLTKEEYETLSKIAPTIAFPDVAWGTSWQEMVRLNAAALGMAAEGEQLISDQEAKVQGALANHPELQGKKILFSYIDPADLSQIGFYTSHDTRPGFLAELGFPMPKVVEDASAQTEEFYTTVSAEEADKFSDVNVFVTYGDPNGDMVEQLQADPLLSKIPAIAAGNIAILENSTPLAASANPSPLSIAWGIEDYFALLGSAVQQQ